jgi:hypothetical protein
MNACNTASDTRGASSPLLRKYCREKMLHQDRDVLTTFAQRRQHHRQDVETVVEILPELALGHHLPQIALCAGEDADVDRHSPRAAQPFDRPVLEHAQQLDLHRQRHVVDVVQEDRAGIGQLEASRPILDGTRERAALVAEEL